MNIHLIEPASRKIETIAIQNPRYNDNKEIQAFLGTWQWAVGHLLPLGDVLALSFPMWFQPDMRSFHLNGKGMVCGPAFVFRRLEVGMISEPRMSVEELRQMISFEFPKTYSAFPGVAHRWPFRTSKSAYFQCWDNHIKLPGFVKSNRFFNTIGF